MLHALAALLRELKIGKLDLYEVDHLQSFFKVSCWCCSFVSAMRALLSSGNTVTVEITIIRVAVLEFPTIALPINEGIFTILL